MNFVSRFKLDIQILLNQVNIVKNEDVSLINQQLPEDNQLSYSRHEMSYLEHGITKRYYLIQD